MSRGVRTQRNRSRTGERIRLWAPIRLTREDGQRVSPEASCTEIGLGGLRVVAAEALGPGTRVRFSLRLPFGGLFERRGRVVWSRQTLHPSLFGATRGHEDDGDFGIAFDPGPPESLLPIARLFAARDGERRRARRIRRRLGWPIHA